MGVGGSGGGSSSIWPEGSQGSPWGHNSPSPPAWPLSPSCSSSAQPGGPLFNCLIHLEQTCPPASHSPHKQDAHLSLRTQWGLHKAVLRPSPQSPRAQILPHKAAIIVNRLSQIPCVPHGGGTVGASRTPPLHEFLGPRRPPLTQPPRWAAPGLSRL